MQGRETNLDCLIFGKSFYFEILAQFRQLRLLRVRPYLCGLVSLLYLLLVIPTHVNTMKLLNKEISKEGGRVSLIPEDAEDMWTVYNLLVSACRDDRCQGPKPRH